jgi:hypothetical protein
VEYGLVITVAMHRHGAPVVFIVVLSTIPSVGWRLCEAPDKPSLHAGIHLDPGVHTSQSHLSNI